MTRSRLAIAGITVVALLSVGAYAIGAPSSNRTGTGTASPTASAAPSTLSSPTPAADLLPNVGTSLTPNTRYGMTLAAAGTSVVLDITIPTSLASAGWQTIEANASEQVIGTADGSQVFGMALADRAISNPCRWQTSGTVAPAGPSDNALRDALLSSLQRASGVAANRVSPDSIGGIFGQFIHAQIGDVSSCDNGEIHAWTTSAGTGPALSGDMVLMALSNGQRILAWTNLDLESDAFWQLYNTMCWENLGCRDHSLD